MLDLLLERAAGFIPVLLSLTVHEWAHAWTAWRLGDDTAKMTGRLSLNPVDHIDPVGTLLLPLMGVPFGWARPVPINPVRFRTAVSMPMGILLTAAAGPISNLLLAAAGCGALAATNAFARPVVSSGVDPGAYAAAREFLYFLVVVNVLLASFNMLPIPPLDGSRIVDAVMPSVLRPHWSRFSALGPLLLAAVILLPGVVGVSVLSWPLGWASELLAWVAAR